MGGRGSRSGGGGGGGPQVLWTLPLVGPGRAAPTPPSVAPGQAVPAISMQQLQAMNDQEFATYLNGLKSTPIDQLTYYNHDWDTQRLIANMPELNRAPDIVDQQTFDALPGQALYRTVNVQGSDSAVDICARTMTSDVTTIGGGRMGDGFYFANDLRHSQTVYGTYKNNINKTATMSLKLNSNAKVVTETGLQSMLSRESSTVQSAINRMSGGGWSRSAMTAYALYKGYNVVKGGAYTNIIDRRAATWSGNVIPWS